MTGYQGKYIPDDVLEVMLRDTFISLDKNLE
jgi:hypothetical protein